MLFVFVDYTKILILVLPSLSTVIDIWQIVKDAIINYLKMLITVLTAENQPVNP